MHFRVSLPGDIITYAMSPNPGDAYDEFKLGNTYQSVIAVSASPTPDPGHSITLGCSSAKNIIQTGDTVYDAFMNNLATVSVTLKTSYEATSNIAATTINRNTKIGEISGVADASYVLTVSQNGFLKRDIAVTVSGADLNLGDKSLIAGDVFADGMIDGSDSELLFSRIGYIYNDGQYLGQLDFNLDGVIDGTDSEKLFSNLGKNIYFYD